MPSGTGIGRHIARRAQENPAHVHQFAERKIGQQDADKKDMDEKHCVDPCRNRRPEGDQAHGEHFDGGHIHFGHIAHENSAKGNAEDQKQREIIRSDGNIFDLANKKPS